MQTESQRVFLKPFPLDIIKYSIFRDSRQSSKCTTFSQENCAICLLLKIRGAPSVCAPPRGHCKIV
nr:MAG TPA: hypothetical protein [Caudoviricetes sp.]